MTEPAPFPLLTVFSIGIAVVALIAPAFSAWVANRTAQSNRLAPLLDDLGSARMDKAVASLRRRLRSDGFPAQWIYLAHIRDRNVQSHEVDSEAAQGFVVSTWPTHEDDVRYLLSVFDRARRLREHGYLTCKSYKLLKDTEAGRALYEIAYPMRLIALWRIDCGGDFALFQEERKAYDWIDGYKPARPSPEIVATTG